MSRSTDKDRVIVAMITGALARYGQGQRCTRGEAIVEVAAVLAKAQARGDRAVQLLTEAAARFVKPTGPGDDRWYPAMVDLLVELGADRAQAVEIRSQTVQIGNLVKPSSRPG